MALPHASVVSSQNKNVATSIPVAENSQGASENVSKKFTGASTVSTMGELKKVAPDLFNQFMIGCATTIIGENNRHIERLKKLMKESQRT